jgi:branched-chain amino acid transport system ATP-binding protein
MARRSVRSFMPSGLGTRSTAVLAATVVLGVLVFVAPLFLDSYATLIFFQVWQLLALSQAWNLLAGYGGMVSLAPAASVGLGGYAGAILGIHLGLPIPVLMLAGGLLAAVFGLLVSVPMFRFRGLYFTIATLVLAETLRLFMINWGLLGGAKGLFLAKYAPSENTLYYYSLVLALVTIAAVVVVLRTRLGLSLRALRDDEDTAQEIGVSTFRTKLWVFVLTSFFMGLMGALQTMRLGVIEPYGAFSLNWTINTVITPIIGGLGTIVGPIIGAFFTIWLGEALSRFPEIHVAITGVIVIAMIRFAPMGIWGIVVAGWNLATRRLRPDRKATTEANPSPASVEATPGTAPTTTLAPARPRPATPEHSPTPAPAALPPGAPLLTAKGVTKRWGDVVAIDGVDLELYDGEVLGIIGPNGAGKSTLVGTLSGALAADAGVIHFGDLDVTHVPAFRRARLGIGRTHQIPRPFAGMTVFENLLVARSYGGREHSSGDIRSDCHDILAEVGLSEAAQKPAGELTLLQLKRLELARALALEPKVLLMDEIGAGLVESELVELIALIHQLRQKVRAIVIIEHIMDVIQKCCDRVAVLDWGKLVATGGVQQVLTSPEVISCYLGTGGGQAVTATPAAAPTGKEVAPLLTLQGVSAGYGGFRALTDVSLTVKPGEVVALLGTNGAGKTTVARAISGMIPTLSGTITFDGKRISGHPAHVVTRRGLAHCMEGRHIFADLTVEENLTLAAATMKVKGAELRERLDRIYDLFEVLAERRRKSGRELSGGQQQMLAIGRALMADPKLVIFDEITLGLAPTTVDRLYETLAAIRDHGMTMLIIEQNVERGLALANHVFVMEKGTVALSGTPAELRGNPRLESLYMGEAC